MYPRRKFLAGVTAVAALAVPAQASAHDTPSVNSVRTHLDRAARSLDAVSARVADRDQAAAAVAFARNRLEMRRARAEAARVTRASASRGSAALQAVARRQDADAEAFVALVEPAAGEMEVKVAKGAAASVKGRDIALAELAGLADRLPAAARAAIARAMTAVVQDSPEDVAALGAGLGSDAVSDAAKPWLQMALAQATAGVNIAIAQLQSLIPQLPAAAQGPVQQALGTVQSVLGMVGGILDGLFGAGGTPESRPPVPGGVPVPQLPIPSGLPIPFGIGG